LESEYSSSGSDLVRDFFIPSLEQSTTYQRASGYFSSSLFVLGPAAWTDFFVDGGSMKLLCSAELSRVDAKHLFTKEDEEDWMLKGFEAAWSKLSSDPTKELTSALLRTLVHFDKLELKIATYRNHAGLFHDKLGIFTDAHGDSVSFTGSANETWNAWSGHGNHESIDVFRSWDSKDANRVQNHKARFSQYWEGRRKDLLVFGGDALKEIVMDKLPDEDLEELLVRVRKEMAKALGLRSRATTTGRPAKALRPYQSEAIENWTKNNHTGVLSFATGGGKTLTAIEGIRQWSASGGSTLILVPTEILVTQWVKEIEAELPSATVLRADSKTAAPWKKLVNTFLSGADPQKPRVTITTYRTAAGSTFSKLVKGSDKLLVVGDEVHRFGAANTRTIADYLKKGASLGLSATPLRKFDDEGTESIYDFFGPALEPTYSLKDAIQQGNLVPYRFKFLTARLSEDENQKWDELTLKIVKASFADGTGNSGEKMTKLLAARARIGKTAESKIAVVGQLLKDEWEANDRWLVYCETEDHIDRVSEQIRKHNPEVTLMRYTTSNEDEHERVMNHFRNSGGVLVAIRCLDEGVDIPLINKAIIVSSSQSQREFVQRRGRVLRPAPNKYIAHLHDFLMETPTGEILASSELERLIEFAEDALNQEPFTDLVRRRAQLLSDGGLQNDG
jgi:superfamily II DNA or RNA helicase